MAAMRPLFFSFLLISGLLAATLQGVQGEAEVNGPSEHECRPYIEKALKQFETGDTPSDEVQDQAHHDPEHVLLASETTTDSVEQHTESDSAEKTPESAETEPAASETAQQDEPGETAHSQEHESKSEEHADAEQHEHEETKSEEQEPAKSEEDAKSAEVEEHPRSGEETQEPHSEEAKSGEQHEQHEHAKSEESAEHAEEAASAEHVEEAASAEHVEEAAASAEQVEEAAEHVEEAASAEQADAPASAEQADAAASAEQADAPASTEQVDAPASAEQADAPASEEHAEQADAPASEEHAEQADAPASEEHAEQSDAPASEEHAEQSDAPASEEHAEAPAEDAASAEQVSSTEEAAPTEEVASTEGAEAEHVEAASAEHAEAEPAEAASAEHAEAEPAEAASAEHAEEATSAEQVKSEETATEEKVESAETAEKTEEHEATAPSGEEHAASEEAKAEEASSSEQVAEGAEQSEEAEQKDKSAEEVPEEDLTLEDDIPTNLRSHDHITEILHLDDESTVKEKSIHKISDVILRDLKRIYENAIKPLEVLYKYRDLSNRHFGDPEIFSKPLVLFMGPWSGGKSSLINYLLDNEFKTTSLRTGAEPSPAYFNILMWGEEPEVLDGTQLAADWTFSGLQKFGQGLEERLRGLKLPSPLLEKINIVEIPGILEVRKQVSRVFPFNDACQWFIDRADIIFLVYDPSKLDVGPETEAILDQLKGREYQTRIILNKADQVKPEELMRVQGALIWNISPLMSSAQPPVMYTTSLWSKPFEVGAPVRLLQAQEKAFLRDLQTAIEKKIENKIASARRFAVRVRNHAKMVDCYLTTYYNHKSVFGNRKLVADAIIEHPQDYHIYEGLSTLTNISRYDLPDPDVYRDFFRLNPLYDFQQLSATCTYFRGCPINRLDVAIAYDLPELVGKYKKMIETETKS